MDWDEWPWRIILSEPYYSPIPPSVEQVGALEFLVVVGHTAEEVCEMRKKSQEVVQYE